MCMKSIYIIIMMTDMLNLTTWSYFFIVKHRIYELEHPSLITDWTSKMGGDAYKKQAK